MAEGDANRFNLLKFNPASVRRRRILSTIELRKNKREQDFQKCRDVVFMDVDEDEQLQGDETMRELTQAAPDGNLHGLARAAQDATHPEEQLAAIQSLRKLIALKEEPPIQEIIDSGVLPGLVECMKNHENSKLQLESVWIITNMLAGTAEQTNAAVAAGIVPPLIQLFTSPVSSVCEQAVWAVGNICGESAALRDCVVLHGAVEHLMAVITTNYELSLIRRFAWMLVNLVRWKHAPLPNTAVLKILPVINILVHHPDLKVLARAVWAINYLAEGGQTRIQMIIDHKIVSKIVALLGHTNVSIQAATLRAIGHIVAGTEEQTQEVLKYDALSYFSDLSTHAEGMIRKEAMWFLSNVVAGNLLQIQAVIDMGLLPKVIENLRTGDFQTREEAAWVVSNLTSCGSRNQIYALLNAGVIGPLCSLLDSQHPETIFVALDGLNNMLKEAGQHVQYVVNLISECNGDDKIEQLHQHENEKIYELANNITKNYFVEEMETDIFNPASTFGCDTNPSPRE